MCATTPFRRGIALTGGIAAIALALPAAAQDAPPYAQLLRDSADTPRMVTLTAEIAHARALAEQAAMRPNPSVSGYVENIARSDPYGGIDRSETTIQYNHPFELAGKRSSRIAAGTAGVAAAQARARAGRLSYAHDLAQAYADAEVATRRIALAQDEVEEATVDLKVARAMVAAGKEARLRQMRAESDIGALQADLAVAQAESDAALARLAVLAGSEQPYTGLSASLLDRLPVQPFTGPVDPADNPLLLAAEADRAVAAARVLVERKRALPDVQAQIGVRRLAGDRATALVAGVLVPLHLFDRNRGNIAAAEAELTAAEAQTRAQRLEARAMTAATLARVTAADQRAQAAEHATVTAAETYRLTRVAYEAGKSPLSEVLSARHDLGVARTTALDAAAARLVARVALARLLGVTLTGEVVE